MREQSNKPTSSAQLAAALPQAPESGAAQESRVVAHHLMHALQAGDAQLAEKIYREHGARLKPGDLAAAIAVHSEAIIQNNTPDGVVELLKRLSTPLAGELSGLVRI